MELDTNYQIAQKAKDKRRRDKEIRDARLRISNYSATIPIEVKELFDNQIGANSLNFQHADDIDRRVTVLENLIRELECQEAKSD